MYLFLFAGAAVAQDYPILNMVADRVIDKYRNATCEQVWQDKEKPKGEMEKNLIQMLRENPQMRQVFIDKVAATVANKMFECGLAPVMMAARAKVQPLSLAPLLGRSYWAGARARPRPGSFPVP